MYAYIFPINSDITSRCLGQSQCSKKGDLEHWAREEMVEQEKATSGSEAERRGLGSWGKVILYWC